MAASIAMSVQGVEEILRGFQILPRNIQRKYLGAAVSEASKNEIPEIKSLTPKGPTGNLRRSVGFKLERKRKNQTAVGILGYRSKTGGTNREKGFHAWWIENGVKVRQPQGRMLKVPLAMASRYPYLKGKVALIGGQGGGALYFRQVKGFAGNGRFGAWAEANLPRMKQKLVGVLENNVGKAIAEQERRDIRSKFGKK